MKSRARAAICRPPGWRGRQRRMGVSTGPPGRNDTECGQARRPARSGVLLAQQPPMYQAPSMRWNALGVPIWVMPGPTHRVSL